MVLRWLGERGATGDTRPMTERGIRPHVPRMRRRILGVARAFSTPLGPEDYLEMINPLWSTRELRGRVQRVVPETADAVTVLIRPGRDWPGHRPGQYLRIGVDIDGVRHWRAYSLTSDPDRPDGLISITPKRVGAGKVSPYLVSGLAPGTIVHLGRVEGEFVLPDPPPRKLLFITAGSGVTPVMSMLRHLEREGELSDVVHLHSARTEDDVIFGPALRGLAARHAGYALRPRHTGRHGRRRPAELDAECPDWRERDAFVSGPADMIDALLAHWEAAGDPDRLRHERFQPVIVGRGDGAGGIIRFRASGAEVTSDGTRPILVSGEEAGLELPFGCRMGICHTCVGTLCAGQVRDLRSGAVGGTAGQAIRTCVHAPEGPVDILL
jgi:stearoyl-CoA 9-desaturase NADPH oxidoreductase